MVVPQVTISFNTTIVQFWMIWVALLQVNLYIGNDMSIYNIFVGNVIYLRISVDVHSCI